MRSTVGPRSLFHRIIRSEGTNFASLGRWIGRRPHVPAGYTALGYSQGALGIPLALSVASLIEIVAMHFLLPWPLVRLAVDILGIYTLLFLLGYVGSLVVRPHLVSANTLLLRQGNTVCGEVPLSSIQSVRGDRRVAPTAPELLKSSRSGESGDADQPTLALAGPNGTNLTIKLLHPVTLAVPSFPWAAPQPTLVGELRLQVDDVATAISLLAPAQPKAQKYPPNMPRPQSEHR